LKAKVAILGAGESGIGAAILAQKKGFDVWVSDKGTVKQKYKDVLEHFKIEFEEGKHSEDRILDAELVVKSPGIPETAPLVRQLLEKGIPVVSEIEFAGRYNKAKTVCITGSNGKTTTTLLLYHILQKAGLNVGLAGNVGKSFARQVAEENFDVYVIELSSFQLDNMYDFRADVAVLMNITPDHLDRYDYKMQNYVNSKFRILQNQNSDDYFIYCDDDEIIRKEIHEREIPAKKVPFGLGTPENPGAGVQENRLIINLNQKQFSMSILDLSLQGKHNTYNSMAAGIASMVFQIRDEHWYALESVHKPIVWIVGGVDKGNDYSMLKNLASEKVKAIVCLGKNNAKIKDAFADCVHDIVETSSMEEAVKAAYYLARNGDSVLLSPACASFDLFDSYEDRGNQFKQQVRNL